MCYEIVIKTKKHTNVYSQKNDENHFFLSKHYRHVNILIELKLISLYKI